MAKIKKLLTSLFILVAIVISFSIVSPAVKGADNLSLSEYTDKVMSLYSTYSVDFNDYRQTLDYSEVRKVSDKYMVSTTLLSSRLGIDIDFDNNTLGGAVIVKLSGSGRANETETVAYGNDIDLTGTDELVSLDLCAESLGYEISYKKDSINIVRPYLTKRLVVKTTHDIDYMGAVEVVTGYNDEIVLQYASEEDARLAHMAYKENPDIEYIDIDFIVETADIGFSEITTGNTYGYRSWGADAMGVGTYTKNLLDDLESSDKSLEENIVAVLDTGIDTDHSWFSGRIASGGKNYLNVNTNTGVITVSTNVEDDNGHGTHVSGIICDLTPNNVKILPMKVLNNEGKGGSLGITAAMRQVLNLVKAGTKISAMNMSLGGQHSVGDDTWDGYNEIVVELKSYNVPTVVAAGNDAASVVGYAPANISSAITVACVGQDTSGSFFRSVFSNYGTYVDIAAPGEEIISAYLEGRMAISSGTSMAAPHVAAAVALLYSDPDTTYTCTEIESILKNNAIDLGNTGWDIYYGEGLVSLEYANSNLLSSSVVFSKTDTSCEESFVLSLSIAETGASIYYTLDGTVPSLDNGTLYTSSITISTTTIVRAIAFVLDSAGAIEKYSRVASITYTFGNQDTSDSYVVDENGVLTDYNGVRQVLSIPTTVDGITVVAVGTGAFTDTTVTRVDLPESVTLIQEKAFASCSTINIVEAPGVTTIEDSAFSDCISFNSLTEDFFPVLTEIGENAFRNCFQIYTVDLPLVIDIGNFAFYMDSTLGTSVLNTVSMPTATTLGEYAFYNCKKLKTIDFSLLETVPYCAFMNTGLESISLGSAVRIGSYAFYNDIALTSASLPKVEFIGMGAFSSNITTTSISYANLLTTLELPELKYIAMGAFGYCNKLTTLTAPNLEYVGRLAFYDCLKLQSFTGGKIAVVCESAFENCSALTEIDLPYATEIRAWAFENSGLQRISLCTAIEYIGVNAINVASTVNLVVEIPLGSTVAENYVIANNLEFTYLHSDYDYLVYQTVDSETITITQLNNSVSMPSEVVIPEYLGSNQLPVTTIASGAFKNCQLITKLISKTITTIQSEAFYYCLNLTYVSLENLRAVGQMAFYRCEYLTHLDIPNIETISSRGFYGCNRLENIILNSTITEIGDESLAFMSNGIVNPNFVIYYNGTSVPSVIVTYASTNNISYQPVYHSIGSLWYTTWTNGTTEEVEIAYIDKNKVGSVVIPSTVDGMTVSSIGIEAFAGCDFITGVSLPSSVKYIGRSAFEGCVSLKEINLDYITRIDSSAFRLCTSLKSISMPQVVTVSNYAFYGCSDLEKVDMPNVSRVGTSGFDYCENLQVVNCPKLETICSYAFYCNSRLSQIDTFALKYVGETGSDKNIFTGCYSLKEIELPNVISITPTAFNSSAIKKVFIGKSFVEFDTTTGSMDTSIDIYGYADSTAETFAESNGNDFYPIDELAFTKNLPNLVTCIEGSDVTLSVTVAGYDISYQWYKTNSSGTTKTVMTNDITNSLVITTTGVGSWYYLVEVSDWTGAVLSSTICHLKSVSQTYNYSITPKQGEHYSCWVGSMLNKETPYVVSSDTIHTNGIPVEFIANLGYSIHTIYLVGDDGTMQTFPRMDEGNYCGLTRFSIFKEERLTQNYRIYATTAPRGDTEYTVNHYKEVLEPSSTSVQKDGLYFDFAESEILTGYTEARTNAQPNAYGGYSAMDYSQKTILADDSQIVDIYYTRNFYTLTLESGTGVDSTIGSGRYKMGTKVTISATMTKGYDWSKWVSSNTDLMADNTSQEVEIEIPMSDIVLTAVGTIKKFTITVIADSGCIITPNIEVKEVDFGSAHTYEFKAIENYQIESVVINGVNKGAIARHKFQSVGENIVIEVTSAKKKVAVSIEANVAGVNEVVNVEIGSSYSFTVPQKSGYNIHYVLVDGEEAEMVDGVVEIETLSEDTTIEVFYAEIRNPSTSDDSDDIVTPPSEEEEILDNPSEQPSNEKDDDFSLKPSIIIFVIIGLLVVVIIVRAVKKSMDRNNRL